MADKVAIPLPKQLPLRHWLLVLQQPLLARYAASVAGELAASAYHAVAG